MKGKILYDIRNLSFATKGEIIHPQFVLTNDNAIREKFYTEDLRTRFGAIISQYDPKNAFIYAEFEIDTQGKSLLDLEKELLSFSSRHIDHVSTFLSFLWLVKDNSISIYNSIIVIPDVEGAAMMSNIKYLTFNINGELERSIFDVQELKYAMQIYERFGTLYSKEKNKIAPTESRINIETDDKGQIVSATENKTGGIKYSSYNCIERGFHFLNVARKERYAAFRIAFYVAILESIFTTDSAMVSHKVGERVARYLEEGIEERKSTYDFIVKVYNTRSTFIHGQKFSENALDPKQLASDILKLDEIIRAVFLMVTQCDYDLFTKVVPKKGSTKPSIELRVDFLKYLVFE